MVGITYLALASGAWRVITLVARHSTSAASQRQAHAAATAMAMRRWRRRRIATTFGCWLEATSKALALALRGKGLLLRGTQRWGQRTLAAVWKKWARATAATAEVEGARLVAVFAAFKTWKRAQREGKRRRNAVAGARLRRGVRVTAACFRAWVAGGLTLVHHFLSSQLELP